MKPVEIKRKFIELRALGYSYDKIAKKLQVAKQTLIEWGKEFAEEIANLKAIELDKLYSEYYIRKEHRLKKLATILNKIYKELETRDLTDIPTEKLLELQLKYSTALSEEYTEPQIKSREEIRDLKNGGLTGIEGIEGVEEHDNREGYEDPEVIKELLN